MSPVVDLVKRAAFMSPTVSSVPYARGGADLAVRHRPAKGRSPIRSKRLLRPFQGRPDQFEAEFTELFRIGGGPRPRAHPPRPPTRLGGQPLPGRFRALPPPLG